MYGSFYITHGSRFNSLSPCTRWCQSFLVCISPMIYYAYVAGYICMFSKWLPLESCSVVKTHSSAASNNDTHTPACVQTADQGGRRVICKVREPLSNQRAAVPPLPCCQVLKWAVPRWGCEYSWGSWHLIRKLMNNALGWLQHDPGRNVSLGSREQTCVDRVGKGLNMEVCPLAYCEEFLSVEGCLHVHELFLFTWSFLFWTCLL